MEGNVNFRVICKQGLVFWQVLCKCKHTHIICVKYDLLDVVWGWFAAGLWFWYGEAQ